ncbi:unnamed protein product, partial [Urochloa decumbens]
MAAHHLPRLPVLLFVFLAVHVPASHGDPALLPTTYDDSMCSDSIMCGRVSITYPFYLSNAMRETANYSGSYSCGYTDLNITCQGEGPSATPVIRLSGESYTVQDISYDSRSIILADSDVLVGGSCPAVRHNITFDEVWLYNTSSDGDLTFYFGCASLDPALLGGLDKYQIDCKGFKSPVPGGGVAFVFTSVDHEKAQQYNLASRCEEVVSVLVNGDVLKDMAGNWTNFTSGGYGYLLKQGFELNWSRMATDQCSLCEQSGGKCSYSQNMTFLGCLCHNGKVTYPYCNSTAPSSSVPLPYYLSSALYKPRWLTNKQSKLRKKTTSSST